MNRKTLVTGLLLCASIFVIGITTVLGASNLLAPYETSEREFRRVEIGDKIVFFHQRMVGGAIVEKDFIVYQFDKNTKALLNKKMHWRDDILEYPMYDCPVITKMEAEAMVDGEIVSSQLYIISPESDIFPIEPTSTNPYWAVTSVHEGHTIITIIDAMTGKRSGYGIAPPQITGFSFSGPLSNNPCSGGWTAWYTNARDWFETMGYPTEDVYWPTEEKIKSHIQSAETAVFYEIAHGDSTSFASGCIGGTTYEYTTATEVKNWIADYKKMPFTFIASCGGICSNGPGTLSYEFRKGSNEDTATVGYCGMSESHCYNPGTCWSVSVSWQTTLFQYMSYGWTVENAYNQAMADYPQCYPHEGACMRFAGDPNFVLESTGANIYVTSPNGGEELLGNETFEITWASGGDIDFVKIEYSINNGTDWIEIIDSTENDGSYIWNIPNNPSEQCLVRISDIDDDPSDESDAVFSILARFIDVPPSHWAYEAIYKIYNAGITRGCSQNPLRYCPDDLVTRAQMAIFLGRGIHGSGFTPPTASGIFDDVPVSHWASAWCERLYNDGITSGCGVNPLRYCPENPVTRAQMAVFLLRAKYGRDYTPPPPEGIFEDVPVDHWAAEWIEQLYNDGITTGCGKNPLEYCPEDPATRSQTAVFFVRTCDL